MPSNTRQTAVLWKGDVPFSAAFDDPYYSLDDGKAESIFVFLEGAEVLNNTDNSDHFVIGETGFGTGLNFLTTWQAWRNRNPGSRLTFISAEAFPITATDMAKAHSAFPDLAELAAQLRTAWPPAASGFHTCKFDDGEVSLLLLFGDATEMFSQLEAKIDAWYLDGFAPAKNPDMWTDKFFKRMSQLSRPKATVATFTAAGFVRRGLEAQGFQMEKSSGFGHKRERLVGSFRPTRQPPNLQAKKPVTWSSTPAADTDHIAVVGDGIAGASVAYSLAQRGLKPILVAPENNHDHTGTLPAAILAPQLLLADPVEKAFFHAAFFHAVSHPAYKDAFASERGTKYLPTSAQEQQKFKDILARFKWGAEWMTSDSEGLILPKGGTVSPAVILEAFMRGIGRINRSVARLEKNQQGWNLLDDIGDTVLSAPTVVLAAGVHTMGILEASDLIGASATTNHPSIRPRGGQLEYVSAQAISGIDNQTITFGGYISAATGTDGRGEIRTIGSTHEKLTTVPPTPPQPTLEAREAILAQCHSITGAVIDPNAAIKSWTGIRATAPDHMPYAGPIPNWTDLSGACACLAIDRKLPLPRAPEMENGLYCLTALGSKGFQYGPLLGEYLAAMICGDPSPLPRNLHAKLHPARGYVSDIIRGKSHQITTKP